MLFVDKKIHLGTEAVGHCCTTASVPKLLVLMLWLLAGCSLGPDFEPPKLDLPTEWRVKLSDIKEDANLNWWEEFGDQKLVEFIDRTLNNNFDLLIATNRVEQFYKQLGLARSDFYPQIQATTSYSRTQISQAQIFPLPNGIPPYDAFNVNTGFSWELDLWGRIRRSNESAKAELIAAEAGRRGVIISTVKELAKAYITLRSLDAQLLVARQTVESRNKSLKLINDRYKAGVISELDVKQVESEVLFAESSVIDFSEQIAKTENAIKFLVGDFPGDIEREKAISNLCKINTLPPYIPSEVLRNRPDLIEAENRLWAATARIGLAKGNYFPKLSLTGTFGYSSFDFQDWIRKPSRFWNIGPKLELPIFTGGKIDNEIDLAKAQAEQALVVYRQSIWRAFQEVNDSMISFNKSKERMDLSAKQEKVIGRYLQLSKVRYDEGQSSYLEVLDAERRHFEVKNRLITAQAQHALALVDMYAALGGGWVSKAEEKIIKKQN